MKEFGATFSGELQATPEQVWDAITVHTSGWVWPIQYEPRVGGAESGLSSAGGTVTAWEPTRRFVTRAERPDGWWNQLDYELEPRPGGTTYLDYRHTSVTAEDGYDVQQDACTRHTAFYYHSLGQYVEHFAGRDATYVKADGPDSSAAGGSFARLLGALGLDDAAGVGTHVRLAPDGVDAIDGIVDYRTAEFVGIRTDDALYRFYGRDAFGWPVGVAHHLFGDGADGETWRVWLDAVLGDEGKVA